MRNLFTAIALEAVYQSRTARQVSRAGWIETLKWAYKIKGHNLKALGRRFMREVEAGCYDQMIAGARS